MVEIKGLERDRDIKQLFAQLNHEVHKVVVGNDKVIEEMLIALFCGGHILLESVPGTGKTLISRTISRTLDCEFKRVQGTPDLQAKDILGGIYLDEQTGNQTLQKGPIFTNILLMDEINRSPPKTQAALLEAMEEKVVSLGGITHKLPKPFIVLATQNPIEQEGVFSLPEAQLDRFLFKSVIEYPSQEEEIMITKSKLSYEEPAVIFNPPEILIIQREIEETVEVSDSVLEYSVKIVQATRNRREIHSGAGPRASIAFMLAAKTLAFLEGRDYVTANDVRRLAHPILRHRILLYSEYSSMRVTPDDIITKILDSIESPME
ncbi:MAG: MoxR family ATPase [Candidatus Altiarchaeota archaeon]|nr:MoxR family ATPase [Candidatus Altiarchaeota archaeon]